MFNLDQAISEWRDRMRAAGRISQDALEELESHLHEDLERQMALGVSAQAAFEAAVARVGDPGALQAEFAKLQPAKRWPKWAAAGYGVVGGCVLLINTWTLLAYELTASQRALGFAIVGLSSLYLGLVPYLVARLAALLRTGRVFKLLSWLVAPWPVAALLAPPTQSAWGLVLSLALWCCYTAFVLTAIALAFAARYGRGGPGGGIGVWAPQPPFPPAPNDGPLAPLARAALAAAGEEAARLGHDFIGTEHLLLGVLRVAGGEMEQFLQALHLENDAVRIEIERMVGSPGVRAVQAQAPWTPRARRALRLAGREARRSNESCMGAEHLVLGLLMEGDGVAGRVLKKLGLRVGQVRAAI